MVSASEPTTWDAIAIVPHKYSLRSSRVTISAENVENVVRPPRNPVVVEQLQLRTHDRMPGDDLHREAHQQAADEIGAQRAKRQRWKHRIEHDAQPPAQPGADRGAASYCKNTAPRHTESLPRNRKKHVSG